MSLASEPFLAPRWVSNSLHSQESSGDQLRCEDAGVKKAWPTGFRNTRLGSHRIRAASARWEQQVAPKAKVIPSLDSSSVAVQ